MLPPAFPSGEGGAEAPDEVFMRHIFYILWYRGYTLPLKGLLQQAHGQR